MTKSPLSDALGVKEHVMAVPKEMIKIARTTGRVGVWHSGDSQKTVKRQAVQKGVGELMSG